MSADCVLLNIKDGVAMVTLDRPDVHNAFDEHLIAALTANLDTVRENQDVFAVVLSGAGKSFSAGADLNWMKRAAQFTEQQNKADALALASMLHKLYTMPKTTIACVRGAAMGGGLGLVACCDIVIAQRDTVFALSEVKLGLIPATIAPYVLRAIGERQARRYFQTGERFDGETAKAIGLVHELVDDESQINPRLDKFTDMLRMNGRQAMTASKKLCLDLAGQPVTSALIDDTATRIARTRAGVEAKEGLSAFLAKRKANW